MEVDLCSLMLCRAFRNRHANAGKAVQVVDINEVCGSFWRKAVLAAVAL
jgi:hypothetical protein